MKKLLTIQIFGILLLTSFIGITQSSIADISNLEDYMPLTPFKPSGKNSGYCNATYAFSTSSIDPSPDKVLWYQWDWGDGTVEWTEEHVSGYACEQFHSWEKPGKYQIKVRCKNNYNTSNWSEPHIFNVTILNHAPNPPIISGNSSVRVFDQYTCDFITIDIDEDNVLVFIDWGDGKTTGWIGPINHANKLTLTHCYTKKGDYTIKAKAKDTKGKEGEFSNFELNVQGYRLIDLIVELIKYFFKID